MHNKFEWIKYVDCPKIENKIVEMNKSFNNKIGLDCFMIVVGETHYQLSLVSLLTLLLNTNVNETGFNILTDQDTYDKHKEYFEFLRNTGVLIHFISDETTKILGNRICKFDFISRGILKNDVVIIDADTYVDNKFDFNVFKEIDNNKLWFLENKYKRSLDVFLNRCGWGFESGMFVSALDIIDKILEFINSKNGTEMSYQEFISGVEHPQYDWFNCGIGFIPLKFIEDPVFKELCVFVRDELFISSDEFVYFIYCNFFKHEVGIFTEVGIPIFLTSLKPDKKGLCHNNETKNQLSSLEKILLTLHRYYGDVMFLKLELETSSKSDFRYGYKFTKGINREDFEYAVINNYSYKSIDSNDLLKMTCNFIIENEVYYCVFNLLGSGKIKVKLFDSIPKITMIRYEPLKDLKGLRLSIEDIYKNKYVNGEFYFS